MFLNKKKLCYIILSFGFLELNESLILHGSEKSYKLLLVTPRKIDGKY